MSFLQHHQEAKHWIFELRLVEHFPVLVDVVSEKPMNVSQGNDVVFGPAQMTWGGAKGNHPDAMAAVCRRMSLLQDLLHDLVNMAPLTATEAR